MLGAPGGAECEQHLHLSADGLAPVGTAPMTVRECNPDQTAAGERASRPPIVLRDEVRIAQRLAHNPARPAAAAAGGRRCAIEAGTLKDLDSPDVAGDDMTRPPRAPTG